MNIWSGMKKKHGKGLENDGGKKFRVAGQWHHLWGYNMEQRLKWSYYLVTEYSRSGEA